MVYSAGTIIPYYIDYQETVSSCPASYSLSGSSCTLPPNTPDPQENIDQACTTAGTNPCNAGTGNKYQPETDYAGSGQFPLRAERTYNSGGTTPSAVQSTVWGSQWRGSYDRSIGYASNGIISTATVRRAGGKQYYYNLSGSSFTGDADVVGTLVRTGVDATGNATGWTYVNEHDELETYDGAGKLVSITNKAGQVQTLTYSDGTAAGGYVLDATGTATATVIPAGKLIRVTDPAGRTLQYGYDTTGRVVKLTDPAGGTYLYTYSDATATANLTTVKYPDGKTRTYLYGEPANVSATPAVGVSYAHALTGIIDENGTRYASWTYDAQGRATSSEHGPYGSGIDKVSLTYTAPDANGNSTTTVTDVMGTTRTYSFSTLLGVVKNTGITGEPCNGCNAALTYDANGNVASRTDFNGNKTCYAYDLVRNLETVRLEGLPAATTCPADFAAYAPTTGSVERKTTTLWHATLRQPTLIAEPLRITSYAYDAQGNLQTRTVQPTNDATGGAGQSAAAVGTARTTTYTYNTAGQVLTVDGARTDVSDLTTYAYDTQGNLATVTNALNQTTTLSGYDANGRVGSITAPNGLATYLSYDAKGRLTSRDAGGEITRYTYDGVGQLTNVSLPNGASYTYTYDAAHRLTRISDAQNNALVYTLDNAGNRTREQLIDAAGNIIQTHSRVFDALSRLQQDIGAVNQTTTYTYDANGNLKTITDPLNRQSVNTYDALNRLAQVTNPDGGIIRYGYDGLDQLSEVTDPRNLVTRYSRDGLGNLNQQTSPDTGVTGHSYDEAGNLQTRTDAKGQTASYSYDALNRLTGISYSGGTSPQTVTYQYDQGANGLGHLTGITDATGTTAYSYDSHGRLTAETRQTQSITYTTGYNYDAQGRLAGITYPSGRTVDYTYDGQGRINRIATSHDGLTQVVAGNIAYRPFGGVQSFTYGDGSTAPVQTYTRQHDQDGRIAGYTLNGQTRAIGYDLASQISFIADPQNLAATANYGYDPMGRLTDYTQGAFNQNYGYDPVGNRTSQTTGSTTRSYSYAPDSNRLTGIQSGAATQSITHDPNGATTADATRQYAYDNRGRLIQATTAQGVINYEVNALGLRVRKQVPYANTDTTYHYDAQGHLIGENPTGSTRYAREYIYLGDQPVAVMQ